MTKRGTGERMILSDQMSYICKTCDNQRENKCALGYDIINGDVCYTFDSDGSMIKKYRGE